jgi:hypothetical protein
MPSQPQEQPDACLVLQSVTESTDNGLSYICVHKCHPGVNLYHFDRSAGRYMTTDFNKIHLF